MKGLISLTQGLSGGFSGSGSVLKLIGLIILTVLIILASYYTTRFIGKKQSGGIQGSSNFKLLDAYRINQTKYLQLVQIGKRYFVLAVCKDSITTVAELSKEDIIFWRESATQSSFKDILAGITGKKTKTEQPADKEIEEEDTNDN